MWRGGKLKDQIKPQHDLPTAGFLSQDLHAKQPFVLVQMKLVKKKTLR